MSKSVIVLQYPQQSLTWLRDSENKLNDKSLDTLRFKKDNCFRVSKHDTSFDFMNQRYTTIQSSTSTETNVLIFISTQHEVFQNTAIQPNQVK